MPVSIAIQHDTSSESPFAGQAPEALAVSGTMAQSFAGAAGASTPAAANDASQKWYLGSSGKFSMLPKQVLDDKRLTLSALRVLIALAKFADSNTGICPSGANAPTLVSLAKLTGIHPNNVSKATSLLEAQRWLKKARQGGGRPTLFTLTIPDTPNPDRCLEWAPERYGRFYIVPVEIAGDHDVTLESLRVFLALSMHADKTSGSCFPGRGTTSRLTGMHVNSISDATAKLERTGWLTRSQRYGHSNIYRLSVPKKAGKEYSPSQSRDYEGAYSFPVHESQPAEYLRTPSPTDAAPEYWY